MSPPLFFLLLCTLLPNSRHAPKTLRLSQISSMVARASGRRGPSPRFAHFHRILEKLTAGVRRAFPQVEIHTSTMDNQSPSGQRPFRPGPAHIRGGIDLTNLDALPPNLLTSPGADESQGSYPAGRHWPRVTPPLAGNQQTAAGNPQVPQTPGWFAGFLLPSGQLAQSHPLPRNATPTDAQYPNIHDAYTRPLQAGPFEHSRNDGMLHQVQNQAQPQAAAHPTMRLSHNQHAPVPSPPRPPFPGPFMDNLYREELLASTAKLHEEQQEKEQAALAEQQQSPAQSLQQHGGRDSVDIRPVNDSGTTAMQSASILDRQQSLPQLLAEQEYQRLQQQHHHRPASQSIPGATSSSRPPSLAATHPVQYQAPGAGPATRAEQTRPSSTTSATPSGVENAPPSASIQASQAGLRSNTTSTQLVKPPWTLILDPMHHTSRKLRPASDNLRGLGSAEKLGGALVVSPVWMIGLPFGSVIEQANTYPDEKIERQRRGDTAHGGQGEGRG